MSTPDPATSDHPGRPADEADDEEAAAAADAATGADVPESVADAYEEAVDPEPPGSR